MWFSYIEIVCCIFINCIINIMIITVKKVGLITGPFAMSANVPDSTPAAPPRPLNRGQKRGLEALGWPLASPMPPNLWNDKLFFIL
jgi:hypothetical protein